MKKNRKYRVCSRCEIEINQILWNSHLIMKWPDEKYDFSGCRRQYLDNDGRVKSCIISFAEAMIDHMKKYYFIRFSHKLNDKWEWGIIERNQCYENDNRILNATNETAESK